MRPVFLRWLCSFAIEVCSLGNNCSQPAPGERKRKFYHVRIMRSVISALTGSTHNVLSAMLSSWHLGKLHLCRGHGAQKCGTPLMPLRADRSQPSCQKWPPVASRRTEVWFGLITVGPSQLLRPCYSSGKGTSQNFPGS